MTEEEILHKIEGCEDQIAAFYENLLSEAKNLSMNVDDELEKRSEDVRRSYFKPIVATVLTWLAVSALGVLISTALIASNHEGLGSFSIIVTAFLGPFIAGKVHRIKETEQKNLQKEYNAISGRAESLERNLTYILDNNKKI